MCIGTLLSMCSEESKTTQEEQALCACMVFEALYKSLSNEDIKTIVKLTNGIFGSEPPKGIELTQRLVKV